MPKKYGPEDVRKYLAAARRAFADKNCRQAIYQTIKAAETYAKVPEDNPERETLREEAVAAQSLLETPCLRRNVRAEPFETPSTPSSEESVWVEKPGYAPVDVDLPASLRRFQLIEMEDSPAERARQEALIAQRRAEWESVERDVEREERRPAPISAGRRLTTREGGFGCACRRGRKY